MRRPLTLLIAFGLAAAACSGSGAVTTTTTTTTVATTTTTTEPTTTTAAPTTTSTTLPAGPVVTTLPEGFRSPINGLSPVLETSLDRRAIAVKIDNHPAARPQSGLQEADGVIELLVEAGFTRFIAVYHDNDSAYIGPVRSIRPTDSTLLPVLGAPLATSGGQPWIQNLTASRGVRIIGEGTLGMFRISSRRAPQNLYGDTTRMRTTADVRNYSDAPPVWLYDIGIWEFPEEPATEIIMRWSGDSRVVWKYEDGRYTRWNGDTPHTWVASDGSTGQIAVDVLVVLTGVRYTAGPPAGVDGDPVPAVDTIGSGQALVFAYGVVWQGTWERDAITEPFRLLNTDGTPAVVPPGVPWVSIFPGGRDINFS